MKLANDIVEKLNDSNYLKKQYEKNSINDIAKSLGVDSTTVRKKLKNHNIELKDKNRLDNANVFLNDKEWLIDQHHIKNRSLKSIANELDVDAVTVAKRFNFFKIQKKISTIPIESIKYLDDKEWLIQQHHIKNKSILEIASELMVTPAVVARKLSKFRIKVFKMRHDVQTKLDNKEWLMEQYYNQGRSFIDIAKELNVDKNTMTKYAKKHGIVNRNVLSNTIISLIDDPKWLMKQHYDNRKSKEEIAKDLGITISTVYNRFIKFGIETQLHKTSLIEKDLREYVSDKNLEIISNIRNIIYPYEIDIWIPEKKIAIEVNGNYWHSEKLKKKNYHLNKTLLAEKKNIQLLHFFESEINNKKNIVQSIIDRRIDSNFYEIDSFSIMQLNNEKIENFFHSNSLEEYIESDINFGLFNDNSELVSVMSFIRRGNDYELSNYTRSIGSHILNDFKLIINKFIIGYCIKNTKIIASSNRRYDNGNDLLDIGFGYLTDSEPELLKLSEEIKLSDVQNRIWDCGKLVFEMIV